MTQTRTALGWGAALVAVGVVLLLRNTGVVGAGIAVWPWALLAAGAALLAQPAGWRAGDLVLPLVLIAVGGIYVLRDVGVLPGVPLVPVVLIAVGVGLLVAGITRRGGDTVEHLAVDLDGTERARVVLAYGAGTLHVAGGAAEGLLCEGHFTGGVRNETHSEDGRRVVTLRHPTDFDRLLWSRRPLDWDVSLSSAIPLDLEVRSGASQVHLDLAQVLVQSLEVKTGASEVHIGLPARGRCRVDIDAGAAEVTVEVPDGVAASVRTRSALASVDVDQRRFPRRDGGFRSADYDTAEHRADIDIEGGVAAFTVR